MDSGLTPEEVHRLLAACQSTHWHPIFHTLIWTGLRRSELLGLRWKDIDLDLATLRVVQVLHQLNGGAFIFQEPKPESTEGRPWGQSLKKPSGAPLNLG